MLTKLVTAWSRLRWGTSSGRAEALFRIAFSFVLLVQLYVLSPNVAFFYSTEACIPPPGELAQFYTPTTVQAAFWIWVVSALLLLVGAVARLAAVVSFVCCLYFLVLRQPATTHAADWLIPSMAFQLMLLPSNRRWAIDARRYRGRSVAAPVAVARWPLFLAQLAVAFFYFTAGTSKLADQQWRSGRGFWLTFANPALSHFDFTAIASAPWISAALSHLVVVWECSMPLLLAFKRTRRWAVVSAVIFLIAVDVTLPVGWFAWFSIANLFVFADAFRKKRAAAELELPRGSLLRELAVSLFLVLHLGVVALFELAYLAVPVAGLPLLSRLITLPVVGPYGYSIANIRYYAVWPSYVFNPVRFAAIEAKLQDGSTRLLPPFEGDRHVHVGWLQSREVREGALSMLAAGGLSNNSWKSYLQHEAELATVRFGGCPVELHAYAIAIGPGPFYRDFLANKRALRTASFDCTSGRPKLLELSPPP